MADEADSKSVVGNHVRVQVPLPAVEIAEDQKEKAFSVFYMRRMHRRSCFFGSERPARRAEKTAFLARLTVCVMKEETKWKEKNWVHGWDLFFCLRDAQLELEMCGDFHISRAYTAEACSYCFICFS